jgi:hypothetical protein
MHLYSILQLYDITPRLDQLSTFLLPHNACQLLATGSRIKQIKMTILNDWYNSKCSIITLFNNFHRFSLFEVVCVKEKEATGCMIVLFVLQVTNGRTCFIRHCCSFSICALLYFFSLLICLKTKILFKIVTC